MGRCRREDEPFYSRSGRSYFVSISVYAIWGCEKGRRPSFTEAARPEQAKPLWQAFNRKLEQEGLHVQTGVFGAMMDVELVNDGPVTILVESK